MVLRLPRLPSGFRLTGPDGAVSSLFLRWFNVDYANAIENADAAQNITLAQIQQTLATAAQAAAVATAAATVATTAQTAADAGGSATARSGTGVASITTVDSGAWVSGPVVNLLTVSAGNASFPGSGPEFTGISLSNPSDFFNGEFRIVEVGSGTTVYSGSMSAYQDVELSGLVFVTNDNVVDLSTFSVARATTGSISYRLDARWLSGPQLNATYTLFARRS